jgi:signal peptide peptidase SppA
MAPDWREAIPYGVSIVADQKYERVTRYVMEMPWAIKPEALGVILDIIEFRANGGKWTNDEIEARIGEDRKSNTVSQRGQVAVIPLHGTIMPRARVMQQISGGRSVEDFVDDLRSADRDPDVSTIVIDVSSPGGSVEQVPETAEVIRSLKTDTVAVANTDAASAAYWLAAQADELVVTPSGEVGSIGVWTAHQNIAGAQKKEGVQTTLISAGKYKVEGHPFGPLEDEAREAIQSKVDHYYGMFIADVALGRGASVETVRNGFGQGRMLTAADAVKEGMADRIATLDQVVSERSDGSAPIAVAASATLTAYFDNPRFGVPGSDDRLRYDPAADKWSVPSTVQGDHTFGHITPMGVCLRGRPGLCINPPDGDIEGFMRFYAPAAGGLRTGVITLAGPNEHGHSPEGVGVVEATKWYDSVGRGVADVRVGRDAYGFWFSGMIRPGTSKKDRYALAASGVSGHWEPDMRGRPALVGLPAVNVEGFPKGYLTAAEVASGIAASVSIEMSTDPANHVEGTVFIKDDVLGRHTEDDCGCAEGHEVGEVDLETILAFAPNRS